MNYGHSRSLGRRPFTWFAALCLATLLLATSCKKPGPQSIVRMSDLHSERQLMSGFNALEAGAWRWTGKQFVVALKAPAGAPQKGAELILQGSLTPDALPNGTISVEATVSGSPVASQTFTKPGEFIYKADVPAAAFTRPVVIAAFTLSQTHQAPGDKRDLGVIAQVISLREK